jgi:hypothetical protein
MGNVIMQEDTKIDVHAVQRVHFVPRPDGGLGFALVIETKDKGTLGFSLPLPALVQIFEMLPKMFADLLRTQPVADASVPENLTHVYWESLASVVATPQISSQGASQTKATLPVKAAATVKSEGKKTTAKSPAAKTTTAKTSAKSVPANKSSAKPTSKATAKTKAAKK